LVAGSPVARMTVTVENRRERTRPLRVIPALRPYVSAANLAPWDVPELYHHARYEGGDHHVFLLRAMSPGGLLAERHNVMMVSDLEADAIAVDYNHFTGAGSWERPEGVLRDGTPAWHEPADVEVRGRRVVFAQRHDTHLEPGAAMTVRMAFGLMPERADGHHPDDEQMATGRKWLTAPAHWDVPSPGRRVELPDGCLARYVNEYLDYQGRMVLHRGWPCNMLGTRDSAQDYTCVVATEPERVRRFLLRIFEVQRSDGWFVRQFSTMGRRGRHDERPYVDSAFFVWELLYLYLVHTGDEGLLDERVPFLDDDNPATLYDHARRILDYYADPANHGEHGLVKIREGDWNDAVNTAGLKGRGESVMASCMAIIAWKQAARLSATWGEDASCYERSAAAMRNHVRRHALNARGFLNGVFNDDGRWIFSDADPDGACRLSVPVNAYGVMADVLEPGEIEPLFRRIDATTNEHGIPLFWPPFGDDPVPHVGRLATGDLSAGLAENGAPYNHGSHGFLARAAAHAGLGERLYELLGWLFPYDQRKHPVGRSKTPPYAIANVWKTAPGWDGEGGDVFFTGGISAGLRAVYEGLVGVEPRPDGLFLRPCLPSGWREAVVRYTYRGCRCLITIKKTEAGAAEMTIRIGGQAVPNPIPAKLISGQVELDIDAELPG